MIDLFHFFCFQNVNLIYWKPMGYMFFEKEMEKEIG